MTKNLLTTALLLALAFTGRAQVVTETVDFNTYASPTSNDLTTRFLPGNFIQPTDFTQTPTGGITGGALVVPPTLREDYLTYCATHRNTLNQQLEASICFKYNTSLIPPSSLPGGAGIIFQGEINRRWIVAFYNNTLQLRSYGYVQDVRLPTGTALQNGHWYRLTSRFTPLGGAFNDQVSAGAQLDDLGTSGTATPTLMVGYTATFADAPMVSAATYQVQVTGMKTSGAELLDNFTFTGVKGSSLCTPLATTDPALPTTALTLSPNPAHGHVAITPSPGFGGQLLALHVRDLRGALVAVPLTRAASGAPTGFDTSALAPGLYLVQAQTSTGAWLQKLVVE
jgi:hypothetical protein